MRPWTVWIRGGDLEMKDLLQWGHGLAAVDGGLVAAGAAAA